MARAAPQSSTYDAIVIGAGHNGLTCATWLAKAGRRVLVVESRDRVGGMAASEEFHPGYRSVGLLHDTTGVRLEVVRALELARHGLKVRSCRPSILVLGDGSGGGPRLLLSGVPAQAAREISRLSSLDGEAYLKYRAFLDRIGPVLRGFLDEPPVNLIDIESAGIWNLMKRALRVRRLGAKEMMELMRLPPMSVADWLGEWFETDLLKAALALDAVAGTWMGPRSPTSNMLLLMHEAAAGPGIEGGGPALAAALEKAARAAGVEILTEARVERILVDGAASPVKGVALSGGAVVSATVVAASCDPKQVLLKLLAPGTIPYRLEHRMEGFRARGTTAQVLLAVKGPVRFAGATDDQVEFARTGGSLVEIERAFDAVKYRRASQTPILDIHVPTVSRPELAPTGGSVVSILVHFAPYDLEGGWDDLQRRALGDRVVAILETQAPGVTAGIVRGEVLSPADIETRYGVTGGQIHHGEHALDQILIRPAPECVGYRTPVPGLYLCGGGSHPGGGLTCQPGTLAARAILKS
ncbi:MAG TPA: NAD(P)/FAD-dependent oxidoreductase [Candidatus Polarisedimenticolia bacterium]|jgi:phytoene dehydrogenase-like protein